MMKLGFGGVSNLLRATAIDAILFLGGRRDPEREGIIRKFGTR